MSLFPVFRKKNSGEIARNRLKLLLVADKADCSPEIMQMIKDDMIRVVSRYLNIDSDRIEIQMKKQKQEDCERFTPVLYANIPIRDIPDKGIY
ncbi:MAG: cell division topological specificity factor MinE [Lacrimispora sp.]|uniref:cell division topological specificity factor MinE n=1 Tax=Lacrimispora sp. TaxID=2719234 RepID=UPI0039E6813C